MLSWLAGSNDPGQLPVLSIQNTFGLQFVKLENGPAALSYDTSGFSNCPIPKYQHGDTVAGFFNSGVDSGIFIKRVFCAISLFTRGLKQMDPDRAEQSVVRNPGNEEPCTVVVTGSPLPSPDIVHKLDALYRWCVSHAAATTAAAKSNSNVHCAAASFAMVYADLA